MTAAPSPSIGSPGSSPLRHSQNDEDSHDTFDGESSTWRRTQHSDNHFTFSRPDDTDRAAWTNDDSHSDHEVRHERPIEEAEPEASKKSVPVTPRRERFVAAVKKILTSVGVFFEKLGNIPYKASSWTGDFTGRAIGCVLGSPFYAVSKIFKWAGDNSLKVYTITIDLDDEDKLGVKQLEELVKSGRSVNKLILNFPGEDCYDRRPTREIIDLLNQLGRQVKGVELKNIGLPSDWYSPSDLTALKARWLIPQTGHPLNHTLIRKFHIPIFSLSALKADDDEYETRMEDLAGRANPWVEFGALRVFSIADGESTGASRMMDIFSQRIEITLAPKGSYLSNKEKEVFNKKALADLNMLENVVKDFEAKHPRLA